MRCINCSVDLHTKYLGICEKCRTISWSPKYINKNLKSVCRENNIEFTGLEGFVKQTNLIYQAINKCINEVSQSIAQNFTVEDERAQAGYAIKLNKRWVKKNIAYDYYIGGTGKHPAYRFLEHLLLYKNAPLERAKAMKHIEEYIWKKGTNTHLRYKLEEALAKRYCKKGFLVYSDMHKDCKKCRPN